MTRDTNTLIAVYMSVRANGNNPAMIAFREQIINDLIDLRQQLEIRGITQEQLDAMWEARQRGKSK